jgi:hypothetical protein
MVCLGWLSSVASKKSNFTPVASLEKTEKLTPCRVSLAPKGKLCPAPTAGRTLDFRPELFR